MDECVDTWPIIAAREYFYGLKRCISVDTETFWTVHHVSRRRIPEFEPSFEDGTPERDRRLAAVFRFADYQSQSDVVTVEIPEMPAESEADDHFEEMQERTAPQRKKKKQSPEVAEAMRQRREAIQARREKAERAWEEWSKPLFV